MIEGLRQRVRENPLVAVIICFAIGAGVGAGSVASNQIVNEAEAGQIHHPEIRDEKWREIIAAESNGGHIPTSMPNVERKRGKISHEFISEGPM